MSSTKRKARGFELERRVRARRESSEELESESSINGDEPIQEASDDSSSDSNSEEEEVCNLNI